MPLKLLRRVRGRVGSASIYQHSKVGLCEVIETHDGTSQIIEVLRHAAATLPSLLARMDMVQEMEDEAGAKRKPKRLGRMPRLTLKPRRVPDGSDGVTPPKRRAGGGG
jgi:hypothetical protein